MRKQRTFNVKTPRSTDGINYRYDAEDGQFVGITILDKITPEAFSYLREYLKRDLNDFLIWAKGIKDVTVVELNQKISFEMFWGKYDDKLRSSKKRSEALWDKLKEDNQVKAFYYIDTYNRHRGSAEKKYCETYLKAELWNN